MPSLLDTLTQNLDGNAIQQMSQQVGASPEAVGRGVSAALPLLVSALAHNTATPQGAHALARAVDNDHDGSILDNLSGFLGGGGSGGIGGAILGHILGSKTGAVQNGVSKASGLDSAQVMQVLMMLAPIVMGAIGKMKQGNSMDAGELATTLQADQKQVDSKFGGAGSLLGSLIDSNGDGQVADDLARLGGGFLSKILGS